MMKLSKAERNWSQAAMAILALAVLNVVAGEQKTGHMLAIAGLVAAGFSSVLGEINSIAERIMKRRLFVEFVGRADLQIGNNEYVLLWDWLDDKEVEGRK